MPDKPITSASLPPHIQTAEGELAALLDGMAESPRHNFIKDQREHRDTQGGWSNIQKGLMIDFNQFIDTHVSVSSSTRPERSLN